MSVAPDRSQPPDQVSLDAHDGAPTGKLPESVAPVAYRVDMKVDPSAGRFSGRVEIDVAIKTGLRKLYLHGRDLVVAEAFIKLENGERVPAAYKQLDDTGLASLLVADEIKPQKATLELTYSAMFNRSLRGLYHVKEGGDDYAFTQFEATDARAAFPCFDEPRFKVPFEFTISAKSSDKVVFNTPPASEAKPMDKTPGFSTHVFARTPPLPTYLIAMVVGPVDIVEGKAIAASSHRDRVIPFRGVAAKGKGKDLKYALANTSKLLLALEEYFGIAYPYKKLDIVAVPDFAAGAMENAGIITFREQLLLLPPGFPVSQERSFAVVMAHELAHQWFGNLVTMPWWDDIWLNEAFATWVQYKVIAKTYPQFKAELSRLEYTQYAMGADSLASARQIRQPIKSHHDIAGAFDSITYSKGWCSAFDVRALVGEEKFQQGIQAYIKRHALGSATYADLLAALDEAAGKDVTTPFKTFLFQPGLPLLSVSQSCDKGKAARRLYTFRKRATRHLVRPLKKRAPCGRYPSVLNMRPKVRPRKHVNSSQKKYSTQPRCDL